MARRAAEKQKHGMLLVCSNCAGPCGASDETCPFCRSPFKQSVYDEAVAAAGAGIKTPLTSSSGRRPDKSLERRPGEDWQEHGARLDRALGFARQDMDQAAAEMHYAESVIDDDALDQRILNPQQRHFYSQMQLTVARFRDARQNFNRVQRAHDAWLADYNAIFEEGHQLAPPQGLRAATGTNDDGSLRWSELQAEQDRRDRRR